MTFAIYSLYNVVVFDLHEGVLRPRASRFLTEISLRFTSGGKSMDRIAQFQLIQEIPSPDLHTIRCQERANLMM
jgi:hypothetical protein